MDSDATRMDATDETLNVNKNPSVREAFAAIRESSICDSPKGKDTEHKALIIEY